MADKLTELLDAHEGIVEKSRFAECPFDLLDRVDNVTEILDATMYVEGSRYTSDGNNQFIYRRCGKTACGAECGVVADDAGNILDFARFTAPCTGKV